MTAPLPGASWTSRVWQACLVLVAVAATARIVEWALSPLLPSLIVIGVLIAVLSLAIGHRRR